MKIVFNNELEYQNDAIASVTKLFAGQEIAESAFTIYDPKRHKEQLAFADNGTVQTEVGVANSLNLKADDLLENLNIIRDSSRLKKVNKLDENHYNFAIEMETGTGKTFVYLKTIFELRKHYGFRKFIILVPSVAIKEGVLSSLRMLSDFFDYHYKEFPFHYFQYSSDKLTDLMEFARSDKVEIMVMTVQSLDSDNKVLHTRSQKHLEKTNGIKPIDVINRCNPVVIIDEPQSTAGSAERKKRIRDLKPLCTLQYSATHKDDASIHKVYRLTAVDAYILKLVKQIEVASVMPKNDSNYAYVKLIEVKATKTKMTAKVEMDIRDSKTGNIERRPITVKPNQSLFDISGRRELYENMSIERMRCNGENQSITVNGREISKGEAINAFDDDLIKRTQIRKTIEEHFEKESRLNPLGIKVLSLFFIDKVANYRSWDGDTQVDGKYYRWFEEEYEAVLKDYAANPKIKAIGTPVSKVHHGYFAEDKGKFKDTKSGETDADIKAYKSIMSDKEDLLSFSNPIRFIFSHSALREGWDNPNVFQICTLNESAKNNDRKRQEIGRGLRICVNQDGERLYGFEYNTLTVMANQSYEDFAKGLQIEIEEEEGFKFGAVSHLSFAAIEIVGSDKVITNDESGKIFDHCRSKGYISVDGSVTESLKSALKDNTLEIPPAVEEYRWEITEYLKKVCGNLNIKPKGEPVNYKQNKRIVEDCPEFEELWKRIKDKTKYSVQYDTNTLIDDAAYKLKTELIIEGVELEYTKAKITQNTTGLETRLTGYDPETVKISYRNSYLPDIISFMQNATNLTRNTVVKILEKSETLHMFCLNPQKYMTDASKIITEVLLKHIISGISYKPIAGSEYYLQEVFPDEVLTAQIDVLVKSDKSVYEYNYCESIPERNFAEAMNDIENVVLYAKLPTRKFIVPTPIGEYTPDWAVVLKENGEHRLYFVVETKSTLNEDERRGKENNKIKCGIKRFSDVGGTGYIVATKKEEFLADSKRFTDNGMKTQRKNA